MKFQLLKRNLNAHREMEMEVGILNDQLKHKNTNNNKKY
jgi:hypothetical protein